MRTVEQRRSRKHTRYLADLMRRAFDDALAQEWGKEYLGYLRERLGASLTRLRRSLAVTALLVIFFFALGAGEVKEITFSGVKLQDFGPVAKLMPAYIAYLTYDTTYLILEIAELRAMLDAATKTILPRISEPGLGYVLDHPNPAVLGGLSIFSTRSNPRHGMLWERLLLVLTAIVLVVLVVVAPLAFLIYAFVHLFGTYGMGDALVWISLGLVAASVLRIVSVLALRIQVGRDEARLEI
jgi:hypothetical protein